MRARLLNFWLRGGGATAQILAKEKSVRPDGASPFRLGGAMRETILDGCLTRSNYVLMELQRHGHGHGHVCTLYKSVRCTRGRQ